MRGSTLLQELDRGYFSEPRPLLGQVNWGADVRAVFYQLQHVERMPGEVSDLLLELAFEIGRFTKDAEAAAAQAAQR